MARMKVEITQINWMTIMLHGLRKLFTLDTEFPNRPNEMF